MPPVVVQTEHLTKKFGSFTAVDDINMSIEEGQVYGFLGPNGAEVLALPRIVRH